MRKLKKTFIDSTINNIYILRNLFIYLLRSQIKYMDLIKFVQKIKALNKEKQILILKFFIDNNVKVSVNKCGTFINMSLLYKEKLEELEFYIADFNIDS